MLRATATLIGLLTLVHGAAWACSCVEVTPEGAVESGDLLVVGTVTEVRSGGCVPRSDHGAPVIRATVAVEEVIAGEPVTGPIEVQTNHSEGACGLSLGEGERWVLQVATGPEPWVSSCTAARRLDGEGGEAWVQALRDTAAAR